MGSSHAPTCFLEQHSAWGEQSCPPAPSHSKRAPGRVLQLYGPEWAEFTALSWGLPIRPGGGENEVLSREWREARSAESAWVTFAGKMEEHKCPSKPQNSQHDTTEPNTNSPSPPLSREHACRATQQRTPYLNIPTHTLIRTKCTVQRLTPHRTPPHTPHTSHATTSQDAIQNTQLGGSQLCP